MADLRAGSAAQSGSAQDDAQSFGHGRAILKRFFLRAFAGIVLATAAVFLVDYLVLRLKIATHGRAYGSVTVHPYYAVPRKDQKLEFLLADPQDQTCVHSLFPHLGDVPCWYLTRNKNKRIDL